MEISANEWMAHSDFLEHYGVPGMKWGKRNARQMPNHISLKKKKKIVPEHIIKNNKIKKQNAVKKRL